MVALEGFELAQICVCRVPSCITELTDYASKMMERQCSLETMKRPKDHWFMQGVRAYQRPYRAIAKQAVDREDYDCPLCFRLFWQPVVTSCGHTYCKVKTHLLLC